MNESKVLNGEKEVVVSDVVNNSSVDAAKAEVNETSKEIKLVPKVITPEDKKDKVEALTHLDEKFVYELMAIPTLSRHEYRLVTFIMLWAKRNNVEYDYDDYGNIYLTKGELAEGEFYPCMTAHLDSVQDKHKAYIQAGAELDVLTRVINGKREIYIDGMGIGGDDKAGVLIALSMFKHVDKLKAAFFLEEEIGCCGSKKLDKEWFDNVGYVLGYDSPELNRAAWSCSGTKLFSADFFKTYMQDVCKEHGLTKFFSEPFTDVKQIREATNIICMNFGSGYYNGHAANEYCVIEDMDIACRMGHALIEKIGNTRHELPHYEKSYVWTKKADGTYEKPEDKNGDDEAFLKTLGDGTRFSGTYGGTGTGAAYAGTTYRGGTAYAGARGGAYQGNGYDDDDDFYNDRWNGYGTANPNKVATIANGGYQSKVDKKEGDVSIETVRYISEKYDNHIDRIEESIKNKCTELGIDFNTVFSQVFEHTIKF